MKKQRFGDNEKASKFISELSHEFIIFIFIS